MLCERTAEHTRCAQWHRRRRWPQSWEWDTKLYIHYCVSSLSFAGRTNYEQKSCSFTSNFMQILSNNELRRTDTQTCARHNRPHHKIEWVLIRHHHRPYRWVRNCNKKDMIIIHVFYNVCRMRFCLSHNVPNRSSRTKYTYILYLRKKHILLSFGGHRALMLNMFEIFVCSHSISVLLCEHARARAHTQRGNGSIVYTKSRVPIERAIWRQVATQFTSS